MKLSAEFYRRPNVVQIAQEMLGKYLFTHIGGVLTGRRIVETEAYAHINDRACHSYLGRFTDRTRMMYEAGGVAYVYLLYGRHALFNIVTNVAGKADAVLIRGLEPAEGILAMRARRGLTTPARNLTAGPGLLTQALGITVEEYGTVFTGNRIWLEDRGEMLRPKHVQASPRVGIPYAGTDAALPWRFRLLGNAWTSPAR